MALLAGDDVLHFNQPTDVAFDRDGNFYVADGEGNSRVLKFDKFGGVLLGWGMKGSGPGQFDLPHSIAIDGDLIYVGDRDNARIQIFDQNGRFLREWKLGHPFGLFITPDHFIYMCDAIVGHILKIDREGKIVGVLPGPSPGKGRHFDPHQICCGQRQLHFRSGSDALARSEISAEMRLWQLGPVCESCRNDQTAQNTEAGKLKC